MKRFFWQGVSDGVMHLIENPPTPAGHFRLALARAATVLRSTKRLGSLVVVLAYQAAIARDDSRAVWHYRLATALEKVSRLEEAVSAYQAALARDDRKADWHFRLGAVLEKLKRSEAAVLAYKAALARDPCKAEYHYRLGITFEKLKKRQEAASAYAAALAREGGNADWHFRLATLLEWDAGALAYVLAPRPSTSVHPAKTKEGEHKWKNVEEAYKQALRLNPSFDLCRYRLARSINRRGDHSKALKILAPIAAENDNIMKDFLLRSESKAARVSCTNLFVEGSRTRSARKIEVLNQGSYRTYFEHTTDDRGLGLRISRFYNYVSSKYKEIPVFLPRLHYCTIQNDFSYALYDYIVQSDDIVFPTNAKTSVLTRQLIETLARIGKEFHDFDPRGTKAPRIANEISYLALERFIEVQCEACHNNREYCMSLGLFRKYLRRHFSEFEALPRVFSHADAHSDNVLVSKDQKVYIIDWDGYGYAPIGFDLTTFFEDGLDNPGFEDAIDCYFDLVRFTNSNKARRYVIALVAILGSMMNGSPLSRKWLQFAVES